MVFIDLLLPLVLGIKSAVYSLSTADQSHCRFGFSMHRCKCQDITLMLTQSKCIREQESVVEGEDN